MHTHWLISAFKVNSLTSGHHLNTLTRAFFSFTALIFSSLFLSFFVSFRTLGFKSSSSAFFFRFLPGSARALLLSYSSPWMPGKSREIWSQKQDADIPPEAYTGLYVHEQQDVVHRPRSCLKTGVTSISIRWWNWKQFMETRQIITVTSQKYSPPNCY